MTILDPKSHFDNAMYAMFGLTSDYEIAKLIVDTI